MLWHIIILSTMLSASVPALSARPAEAANLPPLIPLDRFFDNPEKLGAQISPDGTRLSYLAPEGGQLNIFLRTLGKTDDRALTHNHLQRIFNYFWSRDGKKIFYLQDRQGDENAHLYAIDLLSPDTAARDLTPYEGIRVDEILATPRAKPEEIVLTLNKRDRELFDVYRLNVNTGSLSLVAENPGKVGWWLTDVEGSALVAITNTTDRGREVLVRGGETSTWRSLKKYSNEDSFRPLRLNAGGLALYASSARDSDKSRLVEIDLTTGAERTIDQDPEVDLNDVIFSEKTNKLLAAVYVRDRVRRHVFDPKFRREAAVLEKVHDGDFRIASMDANEKRLIVIYNNDIEPDVTYLYDRSNGRAEFLFTPLPWVRTVQLSRTQPITLNSRDGLTLRGYLTVPHGVSPRNLPMVLKVHGGPWERDRWGYDSEVQFLANRGYAVLQVNFRGSTGYGKQFKRAAIHEFGRKMQDDLIDAVYWAVGRGIADPKRVAIYGGSYGGYATLAGLAFTPDVFACGIDLVGPSSLVTLIKSFPPYWKPFLQSSWYLYVGDPDDPKAVEDMKARSPLYHAERIKSPLLIAQGANDPRVKKAESDQMVESLRKAGKEVEYMVADNEGHGFVSPENMLKFYARMETFLAKHLGPSRLLKK